MVIGGILGNSSRPNGDVEIVPLDGSPPWPCEEPPDYPSPGDKGMVGALVDKEAVVCGRKNGNESECKRYSFENNTWDGAGFRLREPEMYSASGLLLLPNGTLLALGANLDSSLHYCFTPLNSTHVFIGGPNNAHLLHLSSSSWIRIPSMATPREGHSCRSINGGREVVVVGGRNNNGTYLSTSEVFSSSDMCWREAGSLPGPAFMSASVQYNRDTFLIMGGSDGIGKTRDEVYQFDPDTYGWTLREERMQRPRRSHIAIGLNEELRELCQKKK